MNNQPPVCICIPNYNNEKTINETLDSLVKQTYKNIIIKIFDNASTDGSVKILKEYEKTYHNIQVFQNETNIGAEGNFNKCIQNLECEFGALYHSDDIYDPTIIEEQVKFLLNNKECVAVSTDMNLIDEKGSKIQQKVIKELSEDNGYIIVNSQIEMLKKVLEIGNFIVCPTVMMKTDIYKNKIKSYDVENFRTATDLDLWFRTCEYGKFGTILKPLINYRQSSSSYTFRTKLSTNKSDGVYVVDYYYDKFKNKLSKSHKRKYKFFCFKDEVSKTVNQILTNKREFDFKLSVFDYDIFIESIKSTKNFKFIVVGIVVKLLRYFVLPGFLREKLINMRFRRV
ncbi:glycosyltransferase family 2 protein [Campylobacter californiensis]|uniref:glycosyltransferase family 2 protein n=1 Tax=Campylobacter californiensis TaxID=1032243 RepID=UPI001473890B|nr:glycosyltransferase [Campylobacter sp. RM12916]MBE3609030.1 glycosyltransferase [Campylobacter sp. RM12916]